MRFDGIMSHNVIEHFQDPVTELRHMASLLRDKDSVMAHATGCYEYRYEYTRFHTFFYTGRSAAVLAEKAGLWLEEVPVKLPEHQIVKLYHPQDVPAGASRKEQVSA